MYTCVVGEPLDGWIFFFFSFYHGQFTYFYYLLFYPWSLSVLAFSHFTPLWFVFSEGEGVRIPATSYLVPLFTLIYLVLFHLLPPYHLDVPCYLNNRQRYCSVWSERLGLFTSKCKTRSTHAKCGALSTAPKPYHQTTNTMLFSIGFGRRRTVS